MDTNTNNQRQTVHAALPKKVIKKLMKLANEGRRSLNAQVALMIEEALNNGNQK